MFLGIHWNHKKHNVKVPSKRRKYQTLNITGCSRFSFQLKRIFETFAQALVCIQFLDCTMKMFDLHSLLSIVAPMLRNVYFQNTTVLDQKKMPKLKFLFFHTDTGCDVSIFASMVSTNSLKIFKYSETFSKNQMATSRETMNFIKR